MTGPRTSPVDLAAALVELDVPGVVVASVEADATVSTQALGTRGPRPATSATDPMTSRTLLEAASLSKVVAAAVVLTLVREGVVDLDAPLLETSASRRVDPTTYASLTPRLVLSHRSGLPNWAGDPLRPGRADPLVADVAPGSAWGYSGEAYGLLQAHVETLTGSDWPDLVAHVVDLPGSSWSHARGELARGQGSDGIRQVHDFSHPHAAYSLVTCADDLGAFLRWQLHGAGSALLPALGAVEVAVGAPGEGLAWGCGWGLVDQPHGRVAWQWGDNDHFRSFAALDLDGRRGVALLANGCGGAGLAPLVCADVAGDLSRALSWLRSR